MSPQISVTDIVNKCVLLTNIHSWTYKTLANTLRLLWVSLHVNEASYVLLYILMHIRSQFVLLSLSPCPWSLINFGQLAGYHSICNLLSSQRHIKSSRFCVINTPIVHVCSPWLYALFFNTEVKHYRKISSQTLVNICVSLSWVINVSQ